MKSKSMCEMLCDGFCQAAILDKMDILTYRMCWIMGFKYFKVLLYGNKMSLFPTHVVDCDIF